MTAETDLRTYTNQHTEVAFPLGGIGTGTVSIGPTGRLRDWEIFNHPSKGVRLPHVFGAIRCEDSAGDTVTRVLEGEPAPPFTHPTGIVSPSSNLGLPRFSHSEFVGQYPVATIELLDENVPLDVTMRAFTPFIPLNPEDSGIPTACFEYELHNPTANEVTASAVWSMPNVIGYLGTPPEGKPFMNLPGVGGNINRPLDEPGLAGISFSSEHVDSDDLEYGTMAMWLQDVSSDSLFRRTSWERTDWWDGYQTMWDEYRETGTLSENAYEEPTEEGSTDVGSIGTRFTVDPGETHEIRHGIGWHVPNRPQGWDWSETAPTVQNQYATRFDSAEDVARYVTREYGRLRRRTWDFVDAFFGSTVPPAILDAVSSQIATIRSNTCVWLEDGSFLTYEGCGEQRAYSGGSCTHVHNYVQTLSRLFPTLDLRVLEVDFHHSMRDSGEILYRTPLPLGELSGPFAEIPTAADSQFGAILRVYRHWKQTGDDDMLAEFWPRLTDAMRFGIDRWDPDGEGVLSGEQFNTFDIWFDGVTSLTTTWYLTVLKAMAEMAAFLDDDHDRPYRALLERGNATVESQLWNGTHYVQTDHDTDRRHQYGQGCLTDQIVGEWYAEVLELDPILDPERVRNALDTIYTENFRDTFRDHHNCQRVFAMSDDRGVVLCSWPNGDRPSRPFPYSDEVWPGSEYQLAAHLMAHGMIDAGVEIVRAVRDRHDGIKRNPWDEFENGHHYLRSLSNWSVYEAYCGLSVDARDHVDTSDRRFPEVGLDVRPPVETDPFRCFWITAEEWGRTEIRNRDGHGRPATERTTLYEPDIDR